MGKRRALRTEVDTTDLNQQMTKISKQLGVIFKGSNNYYRHTGRRGELLTVSAKDGYVLVSLQGLPQTPKVTTKASQHLGVEGLADIVRRRLDMIRG